MRAGMGIMVWVLVILLPFVAVLMRRGTHDGSPRALGLRRVFRLCAVLAAIAVVPSFAIAEGDDIGIGLSLGLLFWLLLLPGVGVYLRPRPRWVVIWCLWTVPFVGIAWWTRTSVDGGGWEAQVFNISLGTILVLVDVVQPIIVLTKRAGKTRIPPATVQ